MAARMVTIYLNDDDEARWDSMSKGTRSAFVSTALNNFKPSSDQLNQAKSVARGISAGVVGTGLAGTIYKVTANNQVDDTERKITPPEESA